MSAPPSKSQPQMGTGDAVELLECAQARPGQVLWGSCERLFTPRALGPFLDIAERQVEILELLADGLTNAEIAARLYISPKTVDHHVSAILAKLGVQSRRQAAAPRLDTAAAGSQRAGDRADIPLAVRGTAGSRTFSRLLFRRTRAARLTAQPNCTEGAQR